MAEDNFQARLRQLLTEAGGAISQRIQQRISSNDVIAFLSNMNAFAMSYIDDALASILAEKEAEIVRRELYGEAWLEERILNFQFSSAIAQGLDNRFFLSSDFVDPTDPNLAFVSDTEKPIKFVKIQPIVLTETPGQATSAGRLISIATTTDFNNSNLDPVTAAAMTERPARFVPPISSYTTGDSLYEYRNINYSDDFANQFRAYLDFIMPLGNSWIVVNSPPNVITSLTMNVSLHPNEATPTEAQIKDALKAYLRNAQGSSISKTGFEGAVNALSGVIGSNVTALEMVVREVVPAITSAIEYLEPSLVISETDYASQLVFPTHTYRTQEANLLSVTTDQRFRLGFSGINSPYYYDFTPNAIGIAIV